MVDGEKSDWGVGCRKGKMDEGWERICTTRARPREVRLKRNRGKRSHPDTNPATTIIAKKETRKLTG